MPSAAERKPNAVCTVCGLPYWRQPNRLARSRYCSRACRFDGQTGPIITKDDLVRLYCDEKHSMQDIARQLGCSQTKIAYWMTKFGVPKRDWSEATYIQRNPDGDPFSIKLPETPEEWRLFGVGLGLHMGEGAKTGWAVSLVNNNPGIHRTFIRFLEHICGVDRKDLRADLIIFRDCDIEGSLTWWSQQLDLDASQFSRPHIRESRGGTYSRKSQYGTLTVRFDNVKLKNIIAQWCSEYYDEF